MKQTLITLAGLLFCVITFAQSVPQGINYQAVARDVAGAEIANDTLTVQFSVIAQVDSSALTQDIISWQETHTVTTNDFGLFTAVIGQGTNTTVDSSATFNAIDWGSATYSLKLEIDFGSGVFIDMGTTQFMSVPYSLYAKTAANVSATDELQSLTISGDTLFISSRNYIILPTPTLLGCTDNAALNFNQLANTLDNSCCYVGGCTDPLAVNYNPNACYDDNYCIACVNGCMNPLYAEYNPLATCDDSSCVNLLAIGDTYQGGIIFWLDGNGGGLIAAPSASEGVGEWGCYGYHTQGADMQSIGFGAQNTINILSANCSPGNSSNLIAVNICADYTDGTYNDWFLPSKDELNLMYSNLHQQGLGGFANSTYWSSSSKTFIFAYRQNFSDGAQSAGYKDSQWLVVRPVRSFGNALIVINGCTDPTYAEYDASANADDGSCTTLLVNGCTNLLYTEYNPLANTDDGSCATLIIVGCTDSLACNYDTTATDDGTCTYATQYYDCSNTCISDTDGDGVCDELEVTGCTDSLACNYDATATYDGTCTYTTQYYDCSNTCISDTDGDGVCDELEVTGCTDANALNYDATSTNDDGSCIIDCQNSINVSFTTINNMGNGTAGSGNTVFTGVPEFSYNAVPSSGNPVSIIFGAGAMEPNYDEIYIFDENGTILNSSPYYDVSGLSFSSNGSIHIEFDTDGSETRTLDWTVYCAD